MPTENDRRPPSYAPLPPPSAVKFSGARFPDAPPRLGVSFVLGLRRVLLTLADRLTPPEIAIFEHSVGVASTAILGAIAKYGIADELENGPRTAEDLAKACGVDADALHRTLRLLANMGIFTMRRDGTFENNRMSRALMSGRLTRTREWLLYVASASNLASWSDFARTLETGANAFSRVHGRNVWQWFDAHPDEREMFAHAMMGMTTLEAPTIATMYPFGEVKKLCDVGGGRGALLSEILLRHPHLEGVLCDAEGVIASARELFSARGLLPRVTLVAGSFFDAVPEGADAYLMKNILHDWDDAACERILRTVRRAMKTGQRLLLCEMLVERNGRNLLGSRTDLQMMVVCEEGRERGVSELQSLLAKADFRLARTFPFPTTSIVEAEAL